MSSSLLSSFAGTSKYTRSATRWTLNIPAFVFASAVMTRLYGRGPAGGGVMPTGAPRPAADVSVPWPGTVGGGPPRPAFGLADGWLGCGAGAGAGLVVVHAAAAIATATVAKLLAARLIIRRMGKVTEVRGRRTNLRPRRRDCQTSHDADVLSLT